jgi:SagB-type dehydrogenase family enzyme
VKTETLQLPPPRLRGDLSLEEAFCRRRSTRAYRDVQLSDEVIGQLLWAAQGVVDPGGGTRRTAPSAGARYPLETYIATGAFLGHYRPARHALRILRRADVRPELEVAALGQEFVHQASAVIVLTCVAKRIEERYGKSRGARYIAMEAGHAAQNAMLQAVALGLASVPIGAFQDAQVAEILKLRPDERPIYMLAVGRAA